MTCKFCKDYKELREMLEEKQVRRKSKFVAVLREDIEKGGCVSYGGYDLNYCPSCGARLKEKKVRCIDCEHLRVELIKQRNLPDSICTNPLWKELGRAPHVIGHDEHEPILCDHFEKKKKKEDEKDETN